MLADFRVRQRDYLLQISRAITAQLDLAAVLRMVLEATVELMVCQAGLIALRQDDGSFAVRASFGLPEPILELLSPLWTDLPEGGEHGWRTIDLERRLALASAASGVVLRQVVALPMSVGGETVGAIYVFRRWGGRFSANERQMLASFADQAAIAVHNAQLYEQTSREKRRLDAIIEFSADGVMILDAAHRIQVFNRALAALTGWTATEALDATTTRSCVGPTSTAASIWRRLRRVVGPWPVARPKADPGRRWAKPLRRFMSKATCVVAMAVPSASASPMRRYSLGMVGW
jgi:PAS domain-containing protein